MAAPLQFINMLDILPDAIQICHRNQNYLCSFPRVRECSNLDEFKQVCEETTEIQQQCALIHAISSRMLKILDLYAEAGKKYAQIEGSILTPVHIAAYLHYPEAVQLLLTRCCADDTDYADLSGRTHFIIAVEYSCSEAVARYCRVGSVNPNEWYYLPEYYERPVNALRFAVDRGNLEMVKALLEAGARPYFRSFRGDCLDTPLNAACRMLRAGEFDQLKMVKIIFNLRMYNAPPAIVCRCYADKEDSPMFHFKYIKNRYLRYTYLLLILAEPPDMNELDLDGRTIMQLVLQLERHRKYTTRLLFENYYYDPCNNFTTFVTRMMISGADPWLLDPIDQVTSVQLAVSYFKKDVVKVFKTFDVGMDHVQFKGGFFERRRMPFNFLENVVNLLKILDMVNPSPAAIPLDETNSKERDRALMRYLILFNSEEWDEKALASDIIYYSYARDILELGQYSQIRVFFNIVEFLNKPKVRNILPALRFYNIIKHGNFYVCESIKSYVESKFAIDSPCSDVEQIKSEIQATKDFIFIMDTSEVFSLYELLQKDYHTTGKLLTVSLVEFFRKNIDEGGFPMIRGFIKAHLTKSIIRAYFERSVKKYVPADESSLSYFAWEKCINYMTNRELYFLLEKCLRGFASAFNFIQNWMLKKRYGDSDRVISLGNNDYL